MSLRYLFLDMNSYFASVEQQERPELRRRPVAVVPTKVLTTFVLAASYEAKRFGVKTGVMVRDALRMCPDLELIEGRHRLYIQYHHRILEAVDTVLPVLAVPSIDEMVFRLQRDEREESEALKLAVRLKEAIYSQVGDQLRSSVGIAPNRLLAKLASDLRKPDGLTVIQKDDLPDRLLGLELRDFCGIGSKMEKRLHQRGIRTVARFVELTPKEMADVWESEVVGKTWWHLLRGDDLEVRPTRRRTVGNSRVLSPDLRTMASARIVLIRLLHKAAERLRHIDYVAGSIEVSVSYIGRTKWRQAKRISPCSDTLSLVRLVESLWTAAPDGMPLKIGVTLGDLTPPEAQSSPLFEDDQRLGRLGEAMDAINRSLGANAVHLAGMMGTRREPDTRIAFGSLPDLHLPDA